MFIFEFIEKLGKDCVIRVRHSNAIVDIVIVNYCINFIQK